MSSRIEKSIRNMKAASVFYLVKFIVPIVTKTLFIRLLGEVYLGLNASFTSVITLFSITELGISTAIGYQLYKPLAENNEEQIAKLLNEMRRLYYKVSAAVLLLGISFLPILGYIVDVKVTNMEFVYLLCVVNSAASYLCSYKHILISSDQNAYVKTRVKTISVVVTNGLQIAILLLTKSFLLYVLVMIATTISENLIVSYCVDKKYGYLKLYKSVRLEPQVRQELTNNVKFLLKNRIGSQLINTSDSIIVLLVGGVVTTGIYSNYVYIIGIFTSFIFTILESFGASVGNLIAAGDEDNKRNMFYHINFIVFLLGSYCVCMIIALINPFILLWIGPKYTFDTVLIVLLLINFFISIMRQPVVLFKDAMGLFYYDRNRTLITAAVNIILSFVLASFMGIKGVILGTTISMLLITTWFEPFILFRHGYKMSIKAYAVKSLLYAIFTFAVSAGFFLISQFLLKEITIMNWLIAGLLFTIIYVVIVVLLFRKTSDFQYFYQVIVNRLKLNFKRGPKND